jgi:asparagine synthase (glutamine-hydrolysing)
MLTEDKLYVLVFNGELYNFRELRHDLELEGVRFRSKGDTEVVLYALARWGLGALSRFNGMFALGFYDSVEKRLFLARDHAAIKPLYYLLTARGLVFASQYDQILARPWSHGLETSPEALGLYLRLGYIPAPYALLRKTHMLEPGSWLEIAGDGRVRQGKFCEFPLYCEPDLHGEEACEAVDAAVTAGTQGIVIAGVGNGNMPKAVVDALSRAAQKGVDADVTDAVFPDIEPHVIGGVAKPVRHRNAIQLARGQSRVSHRKVEFAVAEAVAAAARELALAIRDHLGDRCGAAILHQRLTQVWAMAGSRLCHRLRAVDRTGEMFRRGTFLVCSAGRRDGNEFPDR